MQDRPDLIQSELAGLAFDSLQQVFRKADVVIAMSLSPLICTENPTVFVVIDPAAVGPQSDYATVSIIRRRGSITVSKSFASFASFLRNRPRVRAPRDESRRVTLIHCHKFRHQVLAQIHTEVGELASLRFRLAYHHTLFQLRINVQ